MVGTVVFPNKLRMFLYTGGGGAGEEEEEGAAAAGEALHPAGRSLHHRPPQHHRQVGQVWLLRHDAVCAAWLPSGGQQRALIWGGSMFINGQHAQLLASIVSPCSKNMSV